MSPKSLTLDWLRVGGAVGVPAQAYVLGPAGDFKALFSSLNLTDAQKEQVKAILKEEQPRLEPLVDQMIRAGRALFQAVTAPTLNERAVRTAADAAGKVAGDLAAVEKACAGSRLRGVLTPEQQSKLDDAIRRAGERVETRVKLGRTIWREHMTDFVDAL